MSKQKGKDADRKEKKDKQQSKIERDAEAEAEPKLQKEKKQKKEKKEKKEKKQNREPDPKQPEEDVVVNTDDKQCSTTCHESIDVDIDVLPEVVCKRIENNNKTTFFIELDINSKPNCRVIKKEVFDPNTCKTIIKHILVLESDVKLDCLPKIKQSRKPSAKYEMDIIIDTESSIRSTGCQTK